MRIRSVVLTVLCLLFVGVLGFGGYLLSRKDARSEFAFVAGVEPEFRANPGQKGIINTVYTFQGHFVTEAKKASAELEEKGLEVIGAQGNSRTFGRSESHPNGYQLVEIAKGKPVREQRDSDTQFVFTDSNPQWVTVIVTEQDPLPNWARGLVGY